MYEVPMKKLPTLLGFVHENNMELCMNHPLKWFHKHLLFT